MILSTARTYLAPYIENGRCAETASVRTVINEAQRRLYSSGNFLGTVRRWGVTVDSNGEFNAPSDCENVMRIAELATGLDYSSTGTVISADANAFLFDSPSLLRFTMIRPGRYKVLGPYPLAVDVMGKVEYKDAVSETDELIIDDRDALKMMVEGIWRENNNAPELAADLLGKAVAHLQNKTMLSVETSKGALYANQLLTAQLGSYGYCRAKASLAFSGGDRTDDARISMLVDDAEKRLMSRLSLWASYLFKVVGGVFSPPHELESVLRLSLDNCPTHINHPTHEFLEYGIGYREDTYGSHQTTYRGDFALQTDMPSASRLAVYASGSNRGIHVTITGRAEDGTSLNEIVRLDGGGVAFTTKIYADVLSISAPPRDGVLSFIAGDVEVACMQAYETSSKRARYSIPSRPNCSTQIVRVLGRPRWIPKVREEQPMQIQNEQAITMMAAAIQLEQAGKFPESMAMEDRAVKLVNDELLHKNMAHGVRIDRAANGMHLKRANSGR